MKKTLHKADSRIVNDLGWLRIHASFRDDAALENRKKFGALLIVDDALMIPGGRGFQLHPHQNMEIVSWVLSGTDEHNDSKHGINLIKGGHVQLMSAGMELNTRKTMPRKRNPCTCFRSGLLRNS